MKDGTNGTEEREGEESEHRVHYNRQMHIHESRELATRCSNEDFNSADLGTTHNTPIVEVSQNYSLIERYIGKELPFLYDINEAYHNELTGIHIHSGKMVNDCVFPKERDYY